MNYATLTQTPRAPGGHRLGTALIDSDQIFTLIGQPTHDWRGQEHDDGKVKLVWVFQTPRGQAELRDYWWNGANEWSIAATNIHAARFLAKHLRAIGVPASTRFNYARDCKRFWPDLPRLAQIGEIRDMLPKLWDQDRFELAKEIMGGIHHHDFTGVDAKTVARIHKELTAALATS